MSLFKSEPAVLHVSRRGQATLADPPRVGAPLDILVSDALTRYWILNCPARLASAHELDLYAADRFAAIFGEDPAHWVLRVDPAAQADRWLACALPASVAIDLPRQAEARGWQPRRVQPHFVREYNRHCRRLDRTAVFCVAAADSTTIGLIDDGRWRGIRVHPPLNRCKADFATLLRRDCRQAGMPVEGLQPVIVGALEKAALA